MGTGQGNKYDVVVVGAGVVGLAAARELLRHGLRVAVVEKEEDVGRGASCRNSGVVHAGFNNQPGSLMAKFCVAGNRVFEAYCRMLDVPYRKTGKLVVALAPEDIPVLRRLKEQGDKNGCPGLAIVDGEFIRRHEPMADGLAALWSPETAIVSPYLLPIALAENFVAGGGDIYLNAGVTGIQGTKEGFLVATDDAGLCLAGRWLVNAAGVFSHQIAALAGDDAFHIFPCRGEYHVLDKRMAGMLRMPIYPAPRPGEGGLGVHLTPTIDGNILIGPSAEYLGDGEDYATTRTTLEKLTREARELLPGLRQAEYIRNYAGIRPKQVDADTGGFADFVVAESQAVPQLINLIGIESPGLTAAPVIANQVAQIIGEREPLKEAPGFQPEHRFPRRLYQEDWDQRRQWVAAHPEAGEVVCRCEEVSKAEVRQAMNNSLGAMSLKAIKYRSRAMMGRCQGGYCSPRIVAMLAEEAGQGATEIRYGREGSQLFCGCLRGDEDA